jgi:hypothetical protein
MTTLYVEEKTASALTQTFTMEKRANIQAIRPNLYFHNDPAGTYTITIKDGANAIGSKSLTMAEIITNANFTANQYHHGFFNFQFDDVVTLNSGIYTLEFSTSGYTFSESSYVGWIKEYEYRTNNIAEGDTVTTVFTNPLSFQIWSYE